MSRRSKVVVLIRTTELAFELSPLSLMQVPQGLASRSRGVAESQRPKHVCGFCGQPTGGHISWDLKDPLCPFKSCTSGFHCLGSFRLHPLITFIPASKSTLVFRSTSNFYDEA